MDKPHLFDANPYFPAVCRQCGKYKSHHIDMTGTYLFLKDCSIMELVALQKEATDCGDTDLRRAVLIEMGLRETRHG